MIFFDFDDFHRARRGVFLAFFLAFSGILSAQSVSSGMYSESRSAASSKTMSAEAKAAIQNKKSGKEKKNAAPVVFNADFAAGEELFSLNEPEKAIPYFEKALEAENVNPAVYVYLGVAYYQTGDYNKSLAVCVQGLAKENTDRKVLAYNAGNSCYAMGNYMRADASYAIALREDENYAPAVLNRANAQLKMDHLEDAKNNYLKYLELSPDSNQKEKIEELIRLLEEEIALRAKQRPELINPDEFVSNEKMEIVEAPEKVQETLPSYAEEKPLEPEKISAAAPALPVEKTEKDDGEKVGENLALQNESDSQKIDENEKSEKIKENPPVLPAAKNDDLIEEKPDENLESIGEIEIPEAVQNEESESAMEKIDPESLVTDDYQKNEEERERIEREKAEKALSLEKEKKEKAARAREELEKEMEEASIIKIDEDDPELNPAAVPDKVEVRENDDGTVDIKIPTLSFEVNSANLVENKANNETVNKVYEILSDKKYSDLKVTITGYVNPDGDEWTSDEKKLALERAESVKKKIVKMGISEERVKAKNGDGKTENKEYNRRVEFLLSKN